MCGCNKNRRLTKLGLRTMYEVTPVGVDSEDHENKLRYMTMREARAYTRTNGGTIVTKTVPR